MIRSVYKKSSDIYSHIDHNNKIIYTDYVYKSPEENIKKRKYDKIVPKNIETHVDRQNYSNIKEKINNNDNIKICDDKNDKDCIQINWNMLKNVNKADPTIWGPTLWFNLHNGAASYPISASKLTKERMKGYIEGLPYIIPCKDCQMHASDYIGKNKDNLDFICSTRDNLFKFFVDFHNEVNKRKNKKIITYEDAKNIYFN